MLRTPDTTSSTGNLAIDANGLNSLHAAAKQNSPEALKAASKQFEALFLNMMLKSMRDATPQDGLLDSDQTKMFTTMLDQQMTQKMADRGVGLADALVRQLSGEPGGHVSHVSPSGSEQELLLKSGNLSSQSENIDPSGQSKSQSFLQSPLQSIAQPSHIQPTAPSATQSLKHRAEHVKAFQDMLGNDAEAASKKTGIPAKFMLGQAALESGWGKREIKTADGSSSHNLFGIKATAGWNGKVVEAPTTEYANGVPQTIMQKFRVYDSYSDAFHDYAHMLSKNPRYGAVIANSHDATSFAQGLQKAGYATDPHYAAKLANIIKKSLV